MKEEKAMLDASKVVKEFHPCVFLISGHTLWAAKIDDDFFTKAGQIIVYFRCGDYLLEDRNGSKGNKSRFGVSRDVFERQFRALRAV